MEAVLKPALKGAFKTPTRFLPLLLPLPACLGACLSVCQSFAFLDFLSPPSASQVPFHHMLCIRMFLQ